MVFQKCYLLPISYRHLGTYMLYNYIVGRLWQHFKKLYTIHEPHLFSAA